MKLYRLLHAINNGIFAMPEHIMANYVDFAISVRTGKANFDFLPKNTTSQESTIKIDANSFELVEGNVSKETIAANSLRFMGTQGNTLRSIDSIDGDVYMCIDVEGTLLKSDACYYGMVDMASWLDAGAKNPKIKGAMLVIDSPGGMVDGTNTLQEAIINFRNAGKPVIGFVSDGMACSAAYYIASACTEIYASKITDILGSIGVMLSIVDYTEANKKLGIAIHVIYAPESGDKNAEFSQVLSGNYELVQRNLLSPIAIKFKSDVEKNRAGKLKIKADNSNTPFTGKIYQASEALKLGLIDKIANREQAFTRLKQLSKQAALATNSYNATQQSAEQSGQTNAATEEELEALAFEIDKIFSS